MSLVRSSSFAARSLTWVPCDNEDTSHLPLVERILRSEESWTLLVLLRFGWTVPLSLEQSQRRTGGDGVPRGRQEARYFANADLTIRISPTNHRTPGAYVSVSTAAIISDFMLV